LYGCSSWIEIVLIHYYDFLKDFIDANIVVRAPTTAGKFDPHGVSFDTFALAHDYQPVQLFADILDGTVLFNPASLLRAVEKEKKRLADLQEKHSEQQDDGSGSDTPSATAQQDQGQKKTRPPPLQPAFERLLKNIEKAFVRKDYDRAHRLLKLLKDITPILKVTRDNKSEHTISNVASLYIDKAYKKSKTKPAKPKTDNSDDNDSMGAPHDENHNDDPSASDAEGGEHDMESLD
jgi:hypothetical protein